MDRDFEAEFETHYKSALKKAPSEQAPETKEGIARLRFMELTGATLDEAFKMVKWASSSMLQLKTDKRLPHISKKMTCTFQELYDEFHIICD